MSAHNPGSLVYVAGEMLVARDQYRGNWEVVMFAEGQLGLVISEGPDSLLVWFAEFGINKKEEHIIACAPLYKQTTKIWSATSALISPGAKEFLSY